MKLTLMQVIERAKIHICSQCKTSCNRCPWTAEQTVRLIQAQADEEERKNG